MAVATTRNVVILVPDGMGPSAVTLARLLSPERALAMDPHLIGASITHAESHIVTDSAAAGTAIATGVRTNNGYVGADTQGNAVAGILEAAKLQRGMAAGLVVTCRVTHATPAAFSSHVLSRGEERTIAQQQIELGLDVMFGGGRQNFVPADAGGKRDDGLNLLDEAAQRGIMLVQSRDAFDGELKLPVIGLFADSDMNYEIDRDPTLQPSLAEMTRRALELLSTREEGFVLLVEGSKIDHAAHAHDAATMIREIHAFDKAFAAVVDFARRDGKTLVVALSDHDTGGMTIITGLWNTDKPGPLRLANVKSSLDKMSGMIVKQGADPADVLAEHAGVTDASIDELAAFTVEGLKTGQASKALAAIINKRLGLAWTTGGHSAVDVGVYAFGPGSERFSGAYPHSRIAATLAELLGVDLNLASSHLAEKFPQGVPAPKEKAPAND